MLWFPRLRIRPGHEYDHFFTTANQSRLWVRCRLEKHHKQCLHKKAVPMGNFRKPLSVPKTSTLPYEPLRSKLANRVSPTLLYQAPSSTFYVIGCYTLGVFLVYVAGFNFETQYFLLPADAPTWVPVCVALGSFMIACVGFWMFFKVRTNPVLAMDQVEACLRHTTLSKQLHPFPLHRPLAQGSYCFESSELQAYRSNSLRS